MLFVVTILILDIKQDIEATERAHRKAEYVDETGSFVFA
jgi:hypothetical protein